MPRQPASPLLRQRGARLAAAVRARREDRNLTAEAVARVTELSVDTIRRIERGGVPNPGFFTVAELAKVLELDLEALALESTDEARG